MCGLHLIGTVRVSLVLVGCLQTELGNDQSTGAQKSFPGHCWLLEGLGQWVLFLSSVLLLQLCGPAHLGFVLMAASVFHFVLP